MLDRDNGAGDFYVKDGVYVQRHGPTPQMDAYIKDIHLWLNSSPVASDLSQRNGGADSQVALPPPRYQN